MKNALLLSFLFLSLFGFSRQSDAHKIRVFAYESNGEIICEAKFNSGRPAKNSTVTVEKDGGIIIDEGQTDKNGEYRFVIPAEAANDKSDLKIVVDLGDGHRGSWLLQAADYLDIHQGVSDSLPPPPQQSITHSQPSAQIPPPECRNLDERLQQMLERELAPIKRALAEEKNKQISLQDILGGLGYIFGLAGIAAYVQFKKQGVKS